MLLLLIAGMLAGLALSQHFKVLILLPATALVVPLAVLAAVARAEGPWWIIVAAIGAAVSLQVGYVVGTGLQAILEAGTSGRRRPSTALRRSGYPQRLR